MRSAQFAVLGLALALAAPAQALSTSSYSASEVAGLLKQMGVASSRDGQFSYDGMPVEVEARELDLNADGQKELLLVLSSAAIYGNTGQAFSLYARSKGSCCKLIFPQTPGMLGFTRQKGKGYRDIIVGGPGFEFPVYRWNGSSYVPYRKAPDTEFQSPD